MPSTHYKNELEYQDSRVIQDFFSNEQSLKDVDKSRTHPGKHDDSSQRCFNVGPSS